MWAARVAETPGAAPVVKEAVENAVGASQIVRTANVAETPGAAKVATRITVEAATGPSVNVETVVERLLRDIFESEESAQIDLDPEQLNELIEVEEAAQTDPEQKQLNHGFLNIIENWLKQEYLTMYNYELTNPFHLLSREIPKEGE